MRALLLTTFLLFATQAEAAETLLRLAETAHVAVHPDEIVANLRAEAAAPTAAAAQSKVNAAIAKALDLARATPGIASSTGTYNVWQRQPGQGQTTPPQWTAVQTIQLRGQDGAAMLALVGRMQADQLALERLSWQLAPETLRAARAEATKRAIAGLRARAREAAGQLGLRFVQFREVRLDDVRAPSGPQPRMAMMAPGQAAPSAEAEDADITATVEADAILTSP
jgi:predicted secreted protein